MCFGGKKECVSDSVWDSVCVCDSVYKYIISFKNISQKKNPTVLFCGYSQLRK